MTKLRDDELLYYDWTCEELGFKLGRQKKIPMF